jgi:hypothetical protein
MPLTSATEFAALPPWLQGIVQELASRSEALSKRPYEKYPLERLAPLPEDILQAQALGRRLGVSLPNIEASEALTRGAAQNFPSQVETYLGAGAPFQQRVLNRIAEEGGRAMNEQIMPALEATFVGLGQHGSSRHRDLAQRAARDLQNEISARQADVLLKGYQQAGQLFNADQLRALEAAREMSGLGTQRQGSQLADIEALTQQGRYQQQQEQASRDVAYEDFLRRQQHPPQLLAEHAATIHGLPTPMQTTSFSQTPGAPQTNVIGNLGSLAGQILSSRLASTGRKRGGSIRRRYRNF